MKWMNKNYREHSFIGFDRPAWWTNTKDLVWELTKILFISLAIIIPIRYFLIQPFYVKGASMEPNFHDHEYLIIDEISYRFHPVNRGDIVVFRYPKDPSQFFIKRVIGLPGERIRLEQNKVYVVNSQYPDGWELPESYLASDVPTIAPSQGFSELALGPEEYFVLGDNRTASLDSRSFGILPRESIVGRAWVRGWPLDRMTVFESPMY